MSSQIRIDVSGPGELQVVADSFTDFIAHFSGRLSRDGVLLSGAPTLPRGSEVGLRFALSDGFALIEAHGLVAEPKTGGTGVHFLVVDSGGDLLDKLVADHLAAGGTPFLVDEVPEAGPADEALAAAEPTSSSEPAPTAQPAGKEGEPEPRGSASEQGSESEPGGATEQNPETEAIRELLVKATRPAFAPGMDRLDGQGSQERQALTGLDAIESGRPSPLHELAETPLPEEAKPPEQPPVATSDDIYQSVGEVHDELQAATSTPARDVVAGAAGDVAASDSEGIAPPPEVETADAAAPTAAAAPSGATDLTDLSDADFSEEIDSALDAAFGQEVDAALDSAFGPTTAASPFADEAGEPPGPGAPGQGEGALDASTRLISIPEGLDDLPVPADLGGVASAAETEPSLGVQEAAAQAASLLGDLDREAAADSEGARPQPAAVPPAVVAEGPEPDDPEPLDDAELLGELPPESELTPVPPPDLDQPLFAAPDVPVDELAAPDLAPSDEEVEAPILAEMSSASELSSNQGSSPVQGTSSEIDLVGAGAVGDVADDASRASLLRGVIPLLLLALIGVGAWKVVDLVRLEFSRLEDNTQTVARVALEEDEELLMAPADSLLAASRLEELPRVSISGEPTSQAATVLENVTWEERPDGTHIVFASDGLLSANDTTFTRLDGERPRIVLKIGGMQQAYFSDQLPLRTAQVARLRFGYHLESVRNEIHVVADLADPEARLQSVVLSPGRMELLIR